jgi:DNA polymerase-3 subunit epsilon
MSERLFDSIARMFAQRSFEDLGAPLSTVTFCVIDLETTGSAPERDAITEVGAVKVCGGECLGTFQTLVNPGTRIPPAITVLTGITEAMVMPAPPITSVLPSLLEFAGGAVLVGHNFRFDLAFLDAALRAAGRARLGNATVDTCALARRLLADEVPNHRLGTLASCLRLDHRPTHRALDDALATTDLLHLLLERAAAYGVLGLDDLLALPRLAGHPQVGKLRLTVGLPRRPGVYVFRNARGQALYVGKATNLRSRVRSYFSGDTRRKVAGLLRETASIDHEECATPLTAAVREVRLIHALLPRYNAHGKRWRSYAYVKLTTEQFPRLSVVHRPKADGAVYLGPVASVRTAKLVVEAIHSVVPLRRCAARIPVAGGPIREAPCAPAQLGVATCPCAGAVDAPTYAGYVAELVAAMSGDHQRLLAPLAERIAALAATERFEEAADARDRAAALSNALVRQRRLDQWRNSGRVVVEVDGARAVLVNGRLADGTSQPPVRPPGDGRLRDPCPAEIADELTCVASYLDTRAARVQLVHADRALTSPLPVPVSFEPRGGRRRQ